MMAGKRQKPPNALADRRPSRFRPLSVLPADVEPVIPEPPEGLGNVALEAWARFFRSPVSKTVNMDAHGPRIRHWAQCLDQRERLWVMWKNQPLIRGSHGQLMTNPLWRTIRDLSQEIARAEEAFGMTPLSQLRLGVTFLHERSLLSSLKVTRRAPVEA